MSSFAENKAERLICKEENKFFVKYHQVIHKNYDKTYEISSQFQFSRVYPKGQRIDSSNYSPVSIWNSGSQMLALNYQTPDKAMQLNQAKFRLNGGCGYLLRPDFMFRDEFDPYDPLCLVGHVDPLHLSVRVIGARHLARTGRGTASPFVEVELIGADFDSGSKLITKTIGKFFYTIFIPNSNLFVADNGFNPYWNESCEMVVHNPFFAFLRFVIQDEDMFGDSNFIGQNTYPVNNLN